MLKFTLRYLLGPWLLVWISGCAQVSPANHQAAAMDVDMKPYPPAAGGYTRQVIVLPHQDDERHLKLELVPGRTLEVDCNQVSLAGTLSVKIANGWGYPYYVLENVQGPISTRMACPPDTQTRLQFVPVVVPENNTLRYNSKLPVVVYLPVGFELHYRIWQAGPLRHDSVER